VNAKGCQFPDSFSQRLQVLDVLERIGQIRLASNSLEEFMRDVLDMLLEVFKADRAYLLFACDPDAPSWIVPMERTRPEWPGAHALGVEIPLLPDVAAEFKLLLATNAAIQYGPKAKRRTPESISQQFSVKSQINTVIRPHVGKPWLMGLHHCSKARHYSKQELFLFDAVADRIADMLSSMISFRELRGRERHFRAYFENSIVGMGSFTPKLVCVTFRR
jgi:hypothetical protein